MMKPVSIIVLAVGVALSAASASAQGNQPQPSVGSPPAGLNAGPMGSMPMQGHMGMHPMAGMQEHEAMMHGARQSDGAASEAGQAAFGAIQEIVRMLQADPMTNWSKVDIDALRQHLIDMDEVTLHAEATKEPIDKGLRIAVTGNGRTLEAIRRMLPAHAEDINGLFGWSVQAKALPNGEELTITAHSAADEQKIRALGFMGIMVLGPHQMHHLAMAKGEPMHMP